MDLLMIPVDAIRAIFALLISHPLLVVVIILAVGMLLVVERVTRPKA